MEDRRYHRYQSSRYRRASSTFRIFPPWFRGWIDGIRGIEEGLDFDSFLLCMNSRFAVFLLYFIEFYPRNYLSSFAYEYIRVKFKL